MSNVNSLEELHNLLDEHGIGHQHWPATGRKSTLDLFQEFQNGDCQLQLNPLRRQVAVVALFIWQDGHLLIETCEHHNGTCIERNWPPSEKRRRQESVIATVHRCLQEEFAGLCTPASYLMQHTWTRSHTEDSPSYPGLLSEYHFDVVELKIPFLPTVPFITHEIDPLTQSNRIHHWTWMEPPATVITQLGEQIRS